jgi:DNA-binding IclR family transcriptional regulator
LISDAGTKQPRSEAELAKDTGFAPWQVKATLAELARHGLVRRLDAETATWEIAHDFLAGIIGQLISQLKSSVWQRLQPFVAPAFLLGWIALAVVGLTF